MNRVDFSKRDLKLEIWWGSLDHLEPKALPELRRNVVWVGHVPGLICRELELKFWPAVPRELIGTGLPKILILL